MHQAVEGLRVRPGFEAARVMKRSRAVQAVPLAVSLSWPPAQAGAAPKMSRPTATSAQANMRMTLEGG